MSIYIHYISATNSSPVAVTVVAAVVVSFLYPVSRLVKTIVEEKESKMREVLKIMGLNDSIHQLAWFIVSVLLFFWIAISSTLYIKSSFIRYSNTGLLFMYYLSFSLSLVTMSFVVSVFFSNAKLSAIAAPVVLVFAILPKFIFFTYQTTEGVSAKIAASLLSPVAFGFGADILGTYVVKSAPICCYGYTHTYICVCFR